MTCLRVIAAAMIFCAAARADGQTTRQPMTPHLVQNCPTPSSVQALEYPSAAVRARENGRVVIGLCVDAAGKPTTFEVLTSSGAERLDYVTMRFACAKRYEPSIDADGNAAPTCAALFEYIWRYKDFPGTEGILNPTWIE
ncbi:MAG: TonB family protein [Alphaproteobacteria bacterium]|nr:MAG: TonB family protein [Alphaproteobacteria bacterium]